MKRKTTEAFIADARAVHGDKYDYSQVEYVNNHTKVDIICPVHGRFDQSPSNHLRGWGCKKCGRIGSENSRRLSTEEFIQKAIAKHGNKYDYSQVEYIDSKTKVKIICPIHGLFLQSPHSHLKGCGCKKCGRDSVSEKISVSFEAYKNQAQIVHNNKYTYVSFIKEGQSKKFVGVICPIHGYFVQRTDIHLNGHGCNKCANESRRATVKRLCSEEIIQQRIYATKKKNGTFNTSRSEENLYELLVNKFGVDDVIRQYKESRYPFACDFYIKSLDLFIELNAFWTHGYHWFDDSNEQDLKVLNEWTLKSKIHHMYKNAIHIWTVTDLLKRDTALRNNLNYKVFWDKNLTDAKEWLDSI